LLALTNEEIVANALIFFLVGFETTTLTVAWAVHLLALNQHEQDLLAKEIGKNIIFKNQVPIFVIMSRLRFTKIKNNSILSQ